jgi:hypothetical protein
MGTPVKIRAREDQCMGAGPCSDPRPMTEEEMLKYYTKEEIDRMGSKIKPPAKEKLIEVLAECEGKTKALYHAVKVFAVSAPVVSKWIKEYGIEFDSEGRAIKESKDVVGDLPPAEEQNESTEPQEQNSNESVGCFESVVIEEQERTKAMTEAAEKEAESIKDLCNLGYAEYDIGNSLIQIDYRKKLVSINEGKEMSFNDATKVSDLLSKLMRGYGSEVQNES